MADCQILSVNKACLSARQSVVKVDRSGWSQSGRYYDEGEAP